MSQYVHPNGTYSYFWLYGHFDVFFWIFKSKPTCAWCVHILMSHFSMWNTYPISILWYIVDSLTHTEHGDMTSQNHMPKISKFHKNYTKITQKFDKNLTFFLTKITQKFDKNFNFFDLNNIVVKHCYILGL